MSAPTPITVALVDDYFPIRKFLASYLGSNGFIITCQAANGEDLLNQLAGLEELPDLCLLDITMPVMDGYETAANLRVNYPEIQILAYSSFTDEDRINKILRAGAHRFISKDSTPNEVRDALVDLQLSTYSHINRPLHLGQAGWSMTG